MNKSVLLVSDRVESREASPKQKKIQMASTVEKEPISCLNDPNYAVVCIFLQKFGHLLEMDLPNTGKLQQMIEDTEEGMALTSF